MSKSKDNTPATPLQKWLDWLGTSDCNCPSEWRGLGRLYGISMGKGWVRMETAPGCRYHSEEN